MRRSYLRLDIVQWAAQECYLQGSGELSVAWMLEAYLYALRRRGRPPTVETVTALGSIVEPVKNAGGLRRVGVRVGNDIKPDSQEVPWMLARLVSHAPTVMDGAKIADAEVAREELATAWFRQYEEIHPFVDGNGRTGSILYNWLRGSLLDPIPPPNLWDDPRR